MHKRPHEDGYSSIIQPYADTHFIDISKAGDAMELPIMAGYLEIFIHASSADGKNNMVRDLYDM